MSVYWKLTDEDAEELSGFLRRRYAELSRKRSGKAESEMALKYWALLVDRVSSAKRNAEPGWLHDCPVTFNLNDEQYNRLCALQNAMSNGEPEDALGFLLTVGSARLINDRLRWAEKAFLNGAETGKEE